MVASLTLPIAHRMDTEGVIGDVPKNLNPESLKTASPPTPKWKNPRFPKFPPD